MMFKVITLRKSTALVLLTLLLLTLPACNSGKNDTKTTDTVNNSEINNNPPIADAGVDQNIINQDIVTLDGSNSSDIDGDTLSYLWSFISKPSGSGAILGNEQTSTAEFISDVDGEYIISLIVNDGAINSAADLIAITVLHPVTNLPPIASNSGKVTSVNTAVDFILIATDNENDALLYQLESDTNNGVISLNKNVITYQPNIDFSGADSFTFTVNDGISNSNVATVTLDVLALSETTILLDDTVVQTSTLVNLGRLLYNDTNLSNPIGQSCASCHDLDTGFDEPNTANPTSVGADGISFGTRNAPTASYSTHIPAPTNVVGVGLIGGLFLDGRAGSLEEQAKGPFLNAVEMGNATPDDVIEKVASSTYATEFELLFGESILDDTTRSYNYIADAIAAFERSSIFSPFSSTFDQVQAGSANFTASQTRGQNIFNNKGDCRRCHHSIDGTEMFSDFTYKNIGVPSNTQLPAFIADTSFVDLGLGSISGNTRNNGEFRIPTLRNIANTSPYMHNGLFTTLKEVVIFYNTRDTTFSDTPEVNQNIDQGGPIGELGLTDNEIDDLVAFLETLTDQ